MVCIVSGVCFREADTCMSYPLMFIVEVVVGMLCVPSLWLLLCCVCIVLIRSLYFAVSRSKRYLSIFAAAHYICASVVCVFVLVNFV